MPRTSKRLETIATTEVQYPYHESTVATAKSDSGWKVGVTFFIRLELSTITSDMTREKHAKDCQASKTHTHTHELKRPLHWGRDVCYAFRGLVCSCVASLLWMPYKGDVQEEGRVTDVGNGRRCGGGGEGTEMAAGLGGGGVHERRADDVRDGRLSGERITVFTVGY